MLEKILQELRVMLIQCRLRVLFISTYTDVTNPIIHFVDNSTDHTLGMWDFDDNTTNQLILEKLPTDSQT